MASMQASWHDALKFRGFGDGGKEIASEVRLNCPEWTGEDLYGGKFQVSQTITDQDYYEGLIRKESTAADPFRWTNEGATMDVGTYERTLFKLSNVTKYFWVDRSIVKRNPAEGARFMQSEATRIVEDTIRYLGKQFFYGSTNKVSRKGFDGLIKFVSEDTTLKAGGSAGSGSDTGLTSAYFIRFNDVDGVAWLFGRDGLFEMSEPEETDIPDSNNGMIPVIKQRMEFYPGLAYFGKYAAVRIANIQTSSASTVGSISKTAFTDEHLMVASDKLKGARADVIIMPRRVGNLLAASRQPSITIDNTTVQTGAIIIPQEWEGIPICYTDSLDFNEAAVA